MKKMVEAEKGVQHLRGQVSREEATSPIEAEKDISQV